MFRLAVNSDAFSVYEGLKLLQDPSLVSLEEFSIYWEKLLRGDFAKNDVWVLVDESTIMGYVLINYFSIPRFVGYGVEMEEVVIMKNHQRKGLGRQFVDYLIKEYSKSNLCRKIIVKTDDIEGAGKLYSEYLDLNEMKTYQLYLNKI